MGHGSIDWDDRIYRGMTFGVKDDAELAVRLGATSRYHRGGRIIFSDDFTYGLAKWIVDDNPTTSAITLNDTVLVVGPQCANMYQHQDSVDDCILSQAIGLVVSSPIALELDLWIYRMTSKFYVNFTLYDGKWATAFSLRFDIENDILQFYARPAGWETVIDPLSAYFCEEKYNSVKLCVASEPGRYCWFRINGHPVDISGWYLYHTNDSRPPNVKIEFELQHTAVYPASARIDSVNLTVEEV